MRIFLNALSVATLGAYLLGYNSTFTLLACALAVAIIMGDD